MRYPRVAKAPVAVCVVLISLMTLMSTASVSAVQSTLYFHDNSELTFSYPSFQLQGYQVSGIQASPSSSSAHVFQTATASPPTASGVALTMSSTISLSSQATVYAAFVSWVTNPFPTNITLDGPVVIHVWMSSNDVLSPWQASEFFVGVGDYSPSSPTPFQALDEYFSNPTVGYNGFSNSPNEYTISTLRINQHQFQAGDELVFFAGAGSNKLGFSFTVYFDSPTRPSRADIPSDTALSMPEFPSAVLIAMATLLFTLTKTRHSEKRTRVQSQFQSIQRTR